MLFAMQVQSITCARRITMDWIGLDGALSTDRGNTKDIRRRERDSGNDRTIIYYVVPLSFCISVNSSTQNICYKFSRNSESGISRCV